MRKKLNKKLIVALLSFVLLFGGTFGSSLAWLLDSTKNVQNTFSTSNIDLILQEDNTKAEDSEVNKLYQMIPGHSMTKDPSVYVSDKSEDCYIFVEVTKSTTLDTYIEYAIYDLYDADNNTDGTWHLLKSENNVSVYYTIIDADNKKGESNAISILGGGSYTDNNDTADDTSDDVVYTWEANEVLTKPSVTKTEMENLSLTGAIQPTLTFKAYAVQLWRTNEPTGENVTDEQIAEAQFTPTQAWEKCPTT